MPGFAPAVGPSLAGPTGLLTLVRPRISTPNLVWTTMVTDDMSGGDAANIHGRATITGGGTWQQGPSYSQGLNDGFGKFAISSGKLVNTIDQGNNYFSLNHPTMALYGRRITVDYVVVTNSSCKQNPFGFNVPVAIGYGSGTGSIYVGGTEVVAGVGLSGTLTVEVYADGGLIVRVGGAQVYTGTISAPPFSATQSDFFWAVPSTASWDNFVYESLEVLTGPVSLTAPDTGTGTDTATLAAALTAADTGTGVDSASLGPTAPDTGAGADTATLAAALTAADTGTGANTATLATALTAADAGAGANTATLAAALTGPDTGSGANAATVAVALTAADTATAVDTATVNTGTTFSGPDTAHGTDSATLAAALTAAETGHGTDSATVTVLLTAADVATAVDTATAFVVSPPLLATATLTGNLGDLIGTDIRNAHAYLIPPVPLAVVDSEIRLGDLNVPLTAGQTFTVADLPTGLYRLRVGYYSPGARQDLTWETPLFPFTANADIADILDAL